MTPRTRAVLAGLALIPLVLMLLLLFRGPTFTTDGYGDPVVHVNCGTILATGWPSDGSYLQDKDYFDHPSFHVSGNPQLSNVQEIGLYQDCNERRDSYLTFLVILAIPFTILLTLALVNRPRSST